MNILVTSAGRRSYLIKYFNEALRGRGKVYASNSEYSVALKSADGYLISPMIYDPGYIDALISFCTENEIGVVISVFDIDLLVLAKNKKKFEDHKIQLILSGPEVVEICNDKWKTYEFLIENGLKSPKTYKNSDSLMHALNTEEVRFPIIIKPRWGMASMGLYIADNLEELKIFYHKSLRLISSSYLKYESDNTIEEPVIFQEVLNGQEYGLDIINDLNGNYVCVLPKSKLAMRAGETDLGRTEEPDRFIKDAQKISSGLRHISILSADCFEVDGQLFFIEFNCRISGHYPLSHLAGTNLPKQIIEWAEGKDTDLDNFSFKPNLMITKELVPVVLKEA